MRMIGSMPSFRFSRSPALTLIAFIGVLCLAYESAQLVLEGNLRMLVVSGMVFVGVVIVVAILNDWRRGLYLLLGWILFEDLFRKYSGNNMAIFFAKDVLAIVLYIAFFAARRERLAKVFKPPFLIPLLIFIWFGVIQVFYPGAPSICYGRPRKNIYFLYIALMYVENEIIETELYLHKFFTFNMVLF